ncbi:MAG: FxDxF family PEP-CTERM protein [Pseudomonadota bacterium]
MRKKLAYLSTVLVAAFMASGAQAAQVIEITGPSGTFGDSEVVCATGATAPCTFTRTFNFVTPAGFNLTSIDISSIASITNPMTDIDFTSVTLNGVNFTTLLTDEFGGQEFRNILNQGLVAGANNAISVNGTTGGNAAFTGNLSFASVAAVPEPAAWMLMLIGMAGVGFSMRRKNKPTLRVRYT